MEKSGEPGETYIYNILRHQLEFKWQEISPYMKYKNSFEAHAYKHPINEKHTGKWNSLINYDNKKTIFDSYYKASVDLSKKYALALKSEYDLRYNERHCSYNILDRNTGLMVCLKFWKNNLRFYIASCYFPSNKIIKLFSASDKFMEKTDISKLDFMMYTDNKHDRKNVNVFEEAMRDFFGIDSIEYKILFENETNNIDDIVNNITTDTREYLNFVKSLIKDEDDKKYYFIYNDGIEYIVKLSLLYKIKDKNYEKLYQEFLNIDINNSYKEALDICKKYIDEGEKNYGRNN